MDRYNVVNGTDKRSKIDLSENFILPDEYSAYPDEFINSLTHFDRLGNGHHGSMKAV